MADLEQARKEADDLKAKIKANRDAKNDTTRKYFDGNGSEDRVNAQGWVGWEWGSRRYGLRLTFFFNSFL